MLCHGILMMKLLFRHHPIPELIRLSYQMQQSSIFKVDVFNLYFLETKKFHSRSHKLFSLRLELEKIAICLT